ncbi:hypothetical protein Nepgr_010740 [Nepenthes gracilis]|uniref:Uncharacterized protein n=1 Tax=Nepenthes gracilis TaxID=150966 RepID=A0AAD3SCV9_NEPGR|nr:hypothetical protein Nepgr_010740 [Nepenthes gracilis]
MSFFLLCWLIGGGSMIMLIFKFQMIFVFCFLRNSHLQFKNKFSGKLILVLSSSDGRNTCKNIPTISYSSPRLVLLVCSHYINLHLGSSCCIMLLIISRLSSTKCIAHTNILAIFISSKIKL